MVFTEHNFVAKRKEVTDKDSILNTESGLREFRKLLAQAQAEARLDDSDINAAQRQSIADELAKREERYVAALADIRRSGR